LTSATALNLGFRRLMSTFELLTLDMNVGRSFQKAALKTLADGQPGVRRLRSFDTAG
jgi:hypothetical protein